MSVLIRGFVFILLNLIVAVGWGQETAENKNPFNIRGVLNSDFTTNSISGIDRRQDPFNFRLNGSLLINTYEWSTSLQVNISDNRTIRRLNLPDIKLPSYQLIGLSPSYKWARFHLGFRSMTFSKYALSGHSFSGAGVELSPGKIKVSAMYGRLRRASAELLDVRQSIDPQYERKGWGFKAGYENGSEHVYGYIFQAKDEQGSENLSFIAPHNNSVIGLQMRKFVGPAQIELDYAYSGFTRDSRAEDIRSYSYGIAQKGFGLFSPNSSTEYRNALTVKASFSVGIGNLFAAFERVDPGYQTMGALFFNNDYENITLGSQLRLSNSSILSFNGGFQRNNLESSETNSMNRLVASAQLNLRPTDRSSINLSYSNFRTTNTLYAVTIPIIQVDSIQLSLVNQQVSFGFQSFLDSNNSTSINGFFSYFRSQAIENDMVNPDQKLNNLNAYVYYNRQLGVDSWVLNGGLQLNRNSSSFNNILTIGPSITGTKKLLEDKMKLSVRLSYISIYMDGQYERSILNPRFRINYSVMADQELVIDSRLIHQNTRFASSPDFSELYTRISWRARF